MLRIKPADRSPYKWMCFHPYTFFKRPSYGYYPEDAVINYCLDNGLHISQKVWDNFQKRLAG